MSFKQNVEQHLQHFAQSIGLGSLSSMSTTLAVCVSMTL